MKKRDQIVIWADYFNSRLGRRQGRRVPLSLAARNPTLDDLRKAAEAIGLRVVAVREARRPGRPGERSGYIQVSKVDSRAKQSLVRDVAKSLMRIKGAPR
ncbi:signal recognition particle subunit SRP19/SEC65 family protein [Conexivisphaera calida]|uniref:signal recognition particle subunit SRP19/SEC65 family protein n=1 Tax=Conexivisphaera calida TaxID=1874277 RepID=UPI00157A9EDC|nr:signal recognition particle subunit SRP19/SEC65 family protein [Conexivisphaera calida]